MTRLNPNPDDHQAESTHLSLLNGSDVACARNSIEVSAQAESTHLSLLNDSDLVCARNSIEVSTQASYEPSFGPPDHRSPDITEIPLRVQEELERSFVGPVPDSPPGSPSPFEEPDMSNHRGVPVLQLSVLPLNLEVNQEAGEEDFDEPPVWSIIPYSSKFCETTICDGRGFSYTWHKKLKGAHRWRCTSRGKKSEGKDPCKAYVRQEVTDVTSNEQKLESLDITDFGVHNHGPKMGDEHNRRMTMKDRRALEEPGNINIYTGEIIGKNNEQPVGPVDCLRTYDQRVKNGNAHRKKLDARHPPWGYRDLMTHEINAQHIGNGELGAENDFLVEDIKVGHDARHILLATKEQLRVLHKMRKVYVDGTFKLVDRPFYQLFSIQGFVEHAGVFKLVPLAFVIMSRRREEDYVAVFESIKQKCNAQSEDGYGMDLRAICLDFELAVWKAIRVVFAGIVIIKGCLFHWIQCIYRAVKRLGFIRAYKRNEDFRRWVRELMALAYLPHAHITPEFDRLATDVRGANGQAIIQYMRNYWITSEQFKPQNWSVYNLDHRTNNDLEGWHSKFNNKTKREIGIYVLMSMLYEEGRGIQQKLRDVYTHYITRHEQAKYRKINEQLHNNWAKLKAKKMSAHAFLVLIAHNHDYVYPNERAISGYDMEDDLIIERDQAELAAMDDTARGPE